MNEQALRQLEEEMRELMEEFYYVLVATGRAPQFIALMKKRAELTARKFPFTPSENRDVAMGQISICYEIVDGAKAALGAANPDDKEAEARRIRKAVASMQ